MNAQALLDALQMRGARVTVEGPTLYVEPRALLTDADRAAIRELKPALFELLLSAPTAVPTGAAGAVTPTAAPELHQSSRPVRSSDFDAGSAYDPHEAQRHALSLAPGPIRAALLAYASQAEEATP